MSHLEHKKVVATCHCRHEHAQQKGNPNVLHFKLSHVLRHVEQCRYRMFQSHTPKVGSGYAKHHGRNGHEENHRGETLVGLFQSKQNTCNGGNGCHGKACACASRHNVSVPTVVGKGKFACAAADSCTQQHAGTFASQRKSCKETYPTVYKHCDSRAEPSECQHATQHAFGTGNASSLCFTCPQLQKVGCNCQNHRSAYYGENKPRICLCGMIDFGGFFRKPLGAQLEKVHNSTHKQSGECSVHKHGSRYVFQIIPVLLFHFSPVSICAISAGECAVNSAFAFFKSFSLPKP